MTDMNEVPAAGDQVSSVDEFLGAAVGARLKRWAKY